MNSDRWEHDLFDKPETVLPEFPRTHGMDLNKEVMGLPHLTLENLHWKITEKDLESMLQMYTVVRVSLRYDHCDRSTGIADVYFKSNDDAVKAHEELDGKELHAQIISAKQAPPMAPRRSFRTTSSSTSRKPILRRNQSASILSSSRLSRDRVYRPTLSTSRRHHAIPSSHFNEERGVSKHSSHRHPASKQTVHSRLESRAYPLENRRSARRHRSSEELDREMEEYMRQRH